MAGPHHISSREIERKFLIKHLPEEILRSRHFQIAQGYLANEPGGRHVRLRKKAKTASLTFKVGRGTSREEREIRLSTKQFAALWPATAGCDCAKSATSCHGRNSSSRSIFIAAAITV